VACLGRRDAFGAVEQTMAKLSLLERPGGLAGTLPPQSPGSSAAQAKRRGPATESRARPGSSQPPALRWPGRACLPR
jgi:hypothetical protein